MSNLSYLSDVTGGTTNNINCADGRTTYSPVCGIYSNGNNKYGTGCVPAPYCYDYPGSGSFCKTGVYWRGGSTALSGINTKVDIFIPTSGGLDQSEFYPRFQSNSIGSTYPIKEIGYKSNGEYTAPYSSASSALPYNNCSIVNSINGGDNCSSTAPCNTELGGIHSDCRNSNGDHIKDGNNGNFCYAYCLNKTYEEDPNCYCARNSHEERCKNNVRTIVPFSLPDTEIAKNIWFRSDDGTGLLYRFDTSLNPTNSAALGAAATGTCSPGVSGYCSAPQPEAGNNSVLSLASSFAGTQYLQYRLRDNDGDLSNNVGGYVLHIQQTKCQRTAGGYATDSYPDRGQIKYVIVPDGGAEPTNSAAGGTIGTGITFDNKRQFQLTPGQTGTLWMLINNKFDDYQYSVGQYNIGVITSVPTSKFSVSVLNPLLDKMRTKLESAGKVVFKNMTCYNSSTSPCTNFFNYIKALLTLYIMIFGLMFLAGMTEITTEDLVIRVAKIAIVAGLMDGGTYNFFNRYVFDLVTSFSDQIISNLAGFNLYSSGDVVNPLMFSDAFLTKIFFSKTTFAQMLALISFGIPGVFFFLMVFIGVMMMVTAIIRSFAVYIMAFVALAFLLSLAPFFLTFLLFEKTYHLFEGWTRVIFRFMHEPIVLLAGIIIFTQLAEIYLDNILGWSVCWKCSLSFSLPFPSFPLTPAFLSAPLFCINWFAPWGYDYRSGLMGIAMSDIAGFGIICFCAYGYGDFSTRMLQKITNSPVGATASGAASKAIQSVAANLSDMADSIKKRTGVDLKGKLEGASPSHQLGKLRGKIGEAGNQALSMTPGARYNNAMKAAKDAGESNGGGGPTPPPAM